MKIVVVGGGVVGLASAYELVRDGHEVVVVEAGKVGAAASHGNAAKIAVAESTPVPSPGMVLQGLKWMLRPDSPLYVKPSLSPRFVSFMTRMARACTPEQYKRGLEVHLEMAATCNDMFDEWISDGLEFEMHRRGVLIAFESEASFIERRKSDATFARFGAHPEVLNAEGVHQVEPALSDTISYGLFYRDDRQIEPDSLTRALTKRARELGVDVREHTRATDFERASGPVRAVLTDRDRIPCDIVVLAAGVWTGPLSDRLGAPLPIRSGKGYSVDYAPAPIEMRTSLTFADAHVAVTPLNGMIRLAGTMEFGGLEASINLRRVEAIKRAACRGFAGWDPGVEHAAPWAGMRPMTPDGLPVVGPLADGSNVLVASGHGMLGLTLAPSTARSIRDLVRGQSSTLLPEVSPERFARRSLRRTPRSATMRARKGA